MAAPISEDVLKSLTEMFAQRLIQMTESVTQQMEERLEQRFEAWEKAHMPSRASGNNDHEMDAETMAPTAENTPGTTATTSGNGSTGTTVEHPRRPKHALPTPSKFDGRRSNWEAWRLEMENKLLVDGAAIGGPNEQFAYVFTLCTGNAAIMLATFARESRGAGHDGTYFLNYMESIYGDPNRQENASNRLRTMRQGKELFATFLPKFERVLAQAGGHKGWPDDVKISTLRGAIADDLRRVLVGNLFLPTKYHEFVAALFKISSQLAIEETHRKSASSRLPASQTMTTAPSQDIAEEMDWEPTRAAHVTTRRAQGYEAKRARWVDEKTYQERKDDGRCLRCGSSEHFIRNCHQRPPRRPTPEKQDGKRKKKERSVVNKAKKEKPYNTRDDKENGDESPTDGESSDESEKE